MGLKIMQERVAKLDGKFNIASVPGRGTTITVTIANNKIHHNNKREKNNE
jgi:signal transduction histidine kinase